MLGNRIWLPCNRSETTHWIQDRDSKKIFSVLRRNGSDYVADFFTKPLPINTHPLHMAYLVHITPRLISFSPERTSLIKFNFWIQNNFEIRKFENLIHTVMKPNLPFLSLKDVTHRAAAVPCRADLAAADAAVHLTTHPLFRCVLLSEL